MATEIASSLDKFRLLNILSYVKNGRTAVVVRASPKLTEYRSKRYCEAEYVQHHVCFLNVQSSLHENVVFSVCARMCNAAYVIFIMWNSISGLDASYHFRLNISCGVAVMVRSHQKNIR